MGWITDGTNILTLSAQVVAAPFADFSYFAFENSSGTIITSAAVGAVITVRVRVKNTGGDGTLAATLDRADTGTRILDVSAFVSAGATKEWTVTFTMPSNNVTATFARYHWV